MDYTTFEAGNVFEAINIIYNLFLEKKYFDFIIIDEHMPYIRGSHMIQLFKKIALENNFYDIKFISYSAFNTKEIRKFILEKGADHVMNKPVNYDQFSELINHFEQNVFK